MEREPNDGPVGHQRWRDLLFLHQPVPTIEQRMPPAIELACDSPDVFPRAADLFLQSDF